MTVFKMLKDVNRIVAPKNFMLKIIYHACLETTFVKFCPPEHLMFPVFALGLYLHNSVRQSASEWVSEYVRQSVSQSVHLLALIVNTLLKGPAESTVFLLQKSIF